METEMGSKDVSGVTAALAEQYYILDRGRVSGPFTREQLQGLAERRRFSRRHQVSLDGEHWSQAAKFPELFPPPPQSPIGHSRQPARRPSPESIDADEPILLDKGACDVLEIINSPNESAAPDTTCVRDYEVEIAGEWYYTHAMQEHGPVSLFDLQQLASMGGLDPDDYVWTDGMPDWVAANSMPHFQFPKGTVPTAAVVEKVSIDRVEETTRTPTASGQTAPMAVASFVLGLSGATILFFLGSILSVAFGHIALRQIRTSDSGLEGRGLAIAGLIMGYAVLITSTVVGLVILLMYLMRDYLVAR